jgi:hypothetical protein
MLLQIGRMVRNSLRMHPWLARIAMNRLHLQLSTVYLDTYETFFADIKGPWAWRFFARFPYPQTLNGLTAPELAETLRALAGGRVGPYSRAASRQILVQQAGHILEATTRLRTQPVTAVHRLRAELIGQLYAELLQIHESQRRLRRVMDDELLPAPGRSLLGLCGVNITLAATVVGEVGDIRRFASRHACANYNGTAPASRSSGGRVRHVARKSGHHRLKRPQAEALPQRSRHQDEALGPASIGRNRRERLDDR